MANAFDIIKENRKEVAEKVIKMMEEGYFFNNPSWNKLAFRPCNPSTNVVYRGGNKIRLMNEAIENKYTDPRWMTFNQISKNGYNLQKGSKGVLCEKWIFDKVEKIKNHETGEVEEIRTPLEQPRVRYFKVFNAKDIDGLPKLEKKELTDKETLDIVDRMIRSSQCKISEIAQDGAFYIPSKDEICLPLRESFKDEIAFSKVCLHEMSHSTGHSSRLDRGMFSSDKYSQTYAKEELRAEIGALFTEKELNLNLKTEHYEDHANYLNHYIKLFKEDPNELFRACTDADKIGDLLIRNYEKQLVLEKVNEISFQVQECSEFHHLGKVKENISSIEEALKSYENFCISKNHMGPGISIIINKQEYPIYFGDMAAHAYYESSIQKNKVFKDAIEKCKTYDLQKKKHEVERKEVFSENQKLECLEKRKEIVPKKGKVLLEQEMELCL